MLHGYTGGFLGSIVGLRIGSHSNGEFRDGLRVDVEALRNCAGVISCACDGQRMSTGILKFPALDNGKGIIRSLSGSDTVNLYYRCLNHSAVGSRFYGDILLSQSNSLCKGRGGQYPQQHHQCHGDAQISFPVFHNVVPPGINRIPDIRISYFTPKSTVVTEMLPFLHICPEGTSCASCLCQSYPSFSEKERERAEENPPLSTYPISSPNTGRLRTILS